MTITPDEIDRAAMRPARSKLIAEAMKKPINFKQFTGKAIKQTAECWIGCDDPNCPYLHEIL